MTQHRAEDGSPLVLHLELLNEWCEEEDKQLLMRYADATERGTIESVIIIPEDMPLHNLHYAIQRLFGWQNSHLRSFYMDAKDFKRLTEERVYKWSILAGILFKGVPEDTDNQFWDEDYSGGSIKSWLRKKYTGPYIYKGYIENYDVAQRDVQNLFQRLPVIAVKESFQEYLKRNKGKKDSEKSPVRVLKKAPIGELTIQELNDAIIFDTGFSELLERIKVRQVLGAEGDSLASYIELLESQLTGRAFKPVTETLLYNYDYGDDWRVEIKRYRDPEVLIDKGFVDESDLREALETVKKKHKPVCIYKKGIFVMDDVGGMSGFTNFMHTIYLGKDVDEKKDIRLWAKGMGWSTRKVEPSKML